MNLKSIRFLMIGALLAFVPNSSRAVLTGEFPGIGALIEKSDVIVVARVVRHVSVRQLNGWSTHDCQIFVTLKGEIPASKVSSTQTLRLLLRDPRFPGGFRFPIGSTHLLFLTNCANQNPTEPSYQTLSIKGASIRLSKFEGNVPNKGKTDQKILEILRHAIESNREIYKSEQKFLKQAIES